MSISDEKMTVDEKILDVGMSEVFVEVRETAEVTNGSDTENMSMAERSQRILATRLDLPFVNLHDYEFDEEVVCLIPASFSLEHQLIPLEITNHHLRVAMAMPMQIDIYQQLAFITGLTIDASVCTKKDVEWAIRRQYGAQDDELALESIDNEHHDDKGVQELERIGTERPIVRLVSNIIRDAADREASDIHIRPREKNIELVYRLDGVLTSIRFFSKSLLAAVVSRIKILGGMNIAERRIPQDGRSSVRRNGNVIDLRISIMPTVKGESVVIRLLNSNIGLKSVKELGFNQHDENIFRDLLYKNNGIFLVTGPTGSGKSTTLYAALAAVQKQNVNIITVEDPVEYQMDGIQQIQINGNTGYSFARALRNILRHDPDVILVGEIRDNETGKIAIESALTGHLVLSTLHTNDAAGAVTRLLEMGIEPYLLNSCLLGVLAQRLVKRNCRGCLEVEPVDSLVRESLAVTNDAVFYRGVGCDSCNHTGVAGRLAVYELLRFSNGLKGLVRPGVATNEIYQQAISEGMVPLTENALQRAKEKEISLAEVYRIRLQ